MVLFGGGSRYKKIQEELAKYKKEFEKSNEELLKSKIELDKVKKELTSNPNLEKSIKELEKSKKEFEKSKKELDEVSAIFNEHWKALLVEYDNFDSEKVKFDTEYKAMKRESSEILAEILSLTSDTEKYKPLIEKVVLFERRVITSEFSKFTPPPVGHCDECQQEIYHDSTCQYCGKHLCWRCYHPRFHECFVKSIHGDGSKPGVRIDYHDGKVTGK